MPKDDKRPEDKRTAPRVDFFDKVKVSDKGGRSQELFAANISQGGMFLRTNRPMPRGNKVTLQFCTPKGEVQIEEAEVVWTKPFDPISIDGSPAGMGIQFTQIPSESSARIADLIAAELGESPPAAQVPSPAPPLAKNLQPAPEPDAGSASPPANPPASPPTEASPPPAGRPPERASMRLELRRAGSSPPSAGVDPAMPVESDPGEPMVSVPPPPRTRIAFFVLFVALVAVVTFFVLRNMMPAADSALGQSEPSTAADSGPSLGAGDGAPVQGAAADAGTAAPQPPPADPVPSPSPPDAGTAVAAAIDAGLKEGPDPAPSTPSSPDAGSAPPADRASAAPPKTVETADIEPPAFAEGADGWTLTLRASAPLKIKHFWLENPPRLAVDFMGGSYGQKKLVFEAPAPGVQRLRVGKQEGFVRFVVDLDPAVNSRAEITPVENGLRIRFGKP